MNGSLARGTHLLSDRCLLVSMRLGWAAQRWEEEGFTVADERPLSVLALVLEVRRCVKSCLVIVTQAGVEEAQLRSSAKCAIRYHAGREGLRRLNEDGRGRDKSNARGGSDR